MNFEDFIKNLAVFYRIELNPGVKGKQFSGAYRELFGGTPEDTLARAYQYIVLHKKSPHFPLPAEVREAIAAASTVVLPEEKAAYEESQRDRVKTTGIGF